MGISPDAVTWGYRFFLGRDPESPEVVATHLRAKDEMHLAQALMNSAEFAARRRHFLVAPPQIPELAHLEVESEATPGEIAACLEKIKAAWSHLGVVAPHFSVRTEKRFLPDNLPGAIEEFWDSGRNEAERVLRTLARHGFAFSGKTCVEYGCGVGRITTGLSRRFLRVDAYDISAAHLDLARKRARELGVGNVRFHECSANILGGLEACDVFYSRLVFQHNPPPVIAQLIRKALGALRPGGIAVFQVPSYRSGYSFKLREWLETDHPLDMQMHCLPQAKIFELIAELRCAVLEVREDGAAGDMFISNTFVVRKLESARLTAGEA
jgi:SAM-dependent methyltransferase